MARFERPKGTIDNIADIRKGDILWHVYGILPPFITGPVTVVRAPYPHGEDGKIVFDTQQTEGGFVEMSFASDGNMKPNHSHNDNYWCRSQDDAEKVRDYLRAQWDANPDLVALEIAERKFEHAIERHMDYYDDTWADDAR